MAIDSPICLTAYKTSHFAIVETIPLELSGEDGVLLIVIRTGFLGAKHAGESCFAVLQLRAAERLHFLTSMCIIRAQPPLWIRCHQSKAESVCYQPIIAGAKSSTIEMGRGSSIVVITEVPDCDKHSQLTLQLPVSRSSFQLPVLALHSTFRHRHRHRHRPGHHISRQCEP